MARMSAARLVSALPSIATLAIAVAYVAIDATRLVGDELDMHGDIWAHAAIVAAQAAALLLRSRLPVPTFAAVVALDALLRITTEGQLGNGALAVAFAAYALWRARGRRALPVLALVGGAGVAAGSIAMALGGEEPLVVVASIAVTVALQLAAPTGVAELVSARERLVAALRERAELADRERELLAQRAVRDERTAMARELHDIAAHHLSGIIVSAQAASALVERDPARSREMLGTVQRDAQTTLADLRRTVGLLRGAEARGDDRGAGDGPEAPATTPAVAAIPDLVDRARDRGMRIALETHGEPRALGPLAETAAYRMVQESLANAARHAPGAEVAVRISHALDAVRIEVVSGAGAVPAGTTPAAPRDGHGLGLLGMAERAELVGGSLDAAPTAEGGWRTALELPRDREPSRGGAA